MSLRETERDLGPFGRFGCCTKAIQVYLKMKFFAVSVMQKRLDISNVSFMSVFFLLCLHSVCQLILHEVMVLFKSLDPSFSNFSVREVKKLRIGNF